jgi:hypothetical protein
VPLTTILDGDYLVSEAVRPGGLGRRSTPGQTSQRRLSAGRISASELSRVEGGVQGNPGEATAASHIYAHILQCPDRRLATKLLRRSAVTAGP